MEREALKEAVRAGTFVPLVALEKITGVDKKSLAALLDREGVPMHANPFRRGRVASRADVAELIEQLRAAGGTKCADCGGRTGSVTAEFCSTCSESRRVRGLQKWHLELNADPERHKAFYAERTRKARPIPESARSFQRKRIREAKDERAAIISERGLWTRDDCVAFLDISKRTLVEHEEAGDFSPVEHVWNGFGFPVPLYDPAHIKTFARRVLLPALNPVRIATSTLALTGSAVIAQRTAGKVDVRRKRYGRTRTGVGRKDELRGVVLAAATQIVDRYQRAGVTPESLTSFCVDVGQLLWEKQVQGGIEWFPPEWVSASDRTTFSHKMRSPVADRIRGLGGDELKKVLQSAGKSST